MKLSQFNFELPPELVPQYPMEHRDESRLMVVHRDTGTIEHKTFKDIIYYFDEKDVLIFNNTKVFPARLYGRKEKTGAKIEVFLLRELNEESRLWDVLVDGTSHLVIDHLCTLSCFGLWFSSVPVQVVAVQCG